MDTLTRIKSFIAVVDEGGFSAAARRYGRSKALISKYVRELEDELGVRLLNRSTRKLSLTDIGTRYYADAIVLVRQFDELQSKARSLNDAPGGRLKISAPLNFGDQRLLDGIFAFAADHPDVDLDLQLENRFVDVVDEGFDLAIRATTLDDSSMIARRLCDLRLVVCGTPALIEKHGRPTEPHHLSTLPCIADTNIKNWTNWPFIVDGKNRSVPVSGSVQVNNAAAARVAGLRGLGFLRSPFPLVEGDIEAGRLVPLLEEFELKTAALMAMYPHKRYLSPTVRALIDHLVLWFK